MKTLNEVAAERERLRKLLDELSKANGPSADKKAIAGEYAHTLGQYRALSWVVDGLIPLTPN